MSYTVMSTSRVYKKGQGVLSSPIGSTEGLGVDFACPLSFRVISPAHAAGELFPLCITKEQTRIFGLISHDHTPNGLISTPDTRIPTIGTWTIARNVIQSRDKTD